MKKTAILSLFILVFSGCGIPNNNSQSGPSNRVSLNIMGGVDADSTFQNANGVVGLILVGRNSTGSETEAICTGNLIASNVVLSAGHCVASSPDFRLAAVFVVFSTNIESAVSEITSNNLIHVRKADAVILHEGFGADKATGIVLNDLSLIRFAGAAPEGIKATIIAGPDQFNSLKAGSALTLAGFGVTSYSIDPATKSPVGAGSGVLRFIENRSVLKITPDNNKIFMSQTDGKGACHGDSGGPAYLFDANTNQNYLIGVTSQGYWLDANSKLGNPMCNQLNVYTDLNNYQAWINSNLKAILLK